MLSVLELPGIVGTLKSLNIALENVSKIWGKSDIQAQLSS